MKSECFFEYIANGFIPWIEEQNIKKPVILFVDGHSTHLTLQVSKLCDENDVILYLLPPNTTHILQPADVGAFKSMKQHWRQEVHEFQRTNPNVVVCHSNVAPLLRNVLERIKDDVIKSGFLATGLCPLDPNRPDYAKCLDIENEEDSEETDRILPTPIDPPVATCSVSIPKLTDLQKAVVARDYIQAILGREKVDNIINGGAIMTTNEMKFLLCKINKDAHADATIIATCSVSIPKLTDLQQAVVTRDYIQAILGGEKVDNIIN